MEFNNYLIKVRDTAVVGTPAWGEAIDALLLMMAPMMPHIAEELWQARHGRGDVSRPRRASMCTRGRRTILNWPRPTW